MSKTLRGDEGQNADTHDHETTTKKQVRPREKSLLNQLLEAPPGDSFVAEVTPGTDASSRERG